MGKNKDKFENKRSILEEQRILEKKLRKLKIPCSHTNNKGKLKVDFINGTLAECKKCGAKFDFGQIELKDLDKAIMVVHNAVNQIKAFSNDPESERGIIIQLGEIDYNLSELRELYKRAVNSYSKNNNKKKNKSDDGFGSYGISNIGFASSKKRK